MARHFTRTEQIDMLLVYGECLQNKRQAQILYAEGYPDRNQPCQAYFQWLIKYLKNLPVNENEEKFVVSEEAEINVLACVNVDPNVSTR